MSSLSIRAPDHLGDAVMSLPAILSLSQQYEIEIHAPRWGSELFTGLPVTTTDAPPRFETGVLFKPSFGAAWRWRHLQRRVGLNENRRGWLLTDPLPVPVGHRRAGYAAVAHHLGAEPAEMPRYTARGDVWIQKPFVGLNPWSPSPTVRWPFFRQLAEALRTSGETVVFFCGPGEASQLQPIADGFLLLPGLSLPDFAATLQYCSRFISNDSGAAHFAAACGIPVTTIHGSTGPERTGVGDPVEAPRRWCQPCYHKSCPFNLACLRSVSVETLLLQVGTPR